MNSEESQGYPSLQGNLRWGLFRLEMAEADVGGAWDETKEVQVMSLRFSPENQNLRENT